MNEIYKWIGFFVFWISALLSGLVVLFYWSAIAYGGIIWILRKLDMLNWIHFYIGRKMIDTYIIRDFYRLKLSERHKRYLHLYRLRNLSKIRR